MTIIDAWMQHPTIEHIQQPYFDSLRRWTGQEAKPIPLEMTLGSMDQAGVGLGLLSAWWAPNGPLIPNEFVHDLVQQHPDRFVGIASVNLKKPMEAVADLRRCVQEWGFKGLRMIQWLWELPPTHRLYYPLYAECVNLGVPICLQVGHTGPLMPSETGRPIPYIDQIAIDFPDLKIVCGHIGYPWTTEMIAVATKHLNVYIDTSAYTAQRYPDELVAYMKRHGRKKVLFGTNYPMIPHAKCLAGLDTLGLDEETQADFLYRNTARVFDLTLASA